VRRQPRRTWRWSSKAAAAAKAAEATKGAFCGCQGCQGNEGREGCSSCEGGEGVEGPLRRHLLRRPPKTTAKALRKASAAAKAAKASKAVAAKAAKAAATNRMLVAVGGGPLQALPCLTRHARGVHHLGGALRDPGGGGGDRVEESCSKGCGINGRSSCARGSSARKRRRCSQSRKVRPRPRACDRKAVSAYRTGRAVHGRRRVARRCAAASATAAELPRRAESPASSIARDRERERMRSPPGAASGARCHGGSTGADRSLAEAMQIVYLRRRLSVRWPGHGQWRC
jgi:hypothetical protein